MNTDLIPQPTELRDYAKSLGWKLLDEALRDRLYVMESDQFPRRQLVFPMDTTAPDFHGTLMIVAEKLAELYKKDVARILSEILTVRDDTLRFRVSTDRDAEPSLPLAYASGLLAGAQQLLLSSACTVLRPQIHHPRLSRTEAQELLNATRFGHTEEGSFVLKVSCPIHALDLQVPPLLWDDIAGSFPSSGDLAAPFVRRATLTIARALAEVIRAIEADKVVDLLDRTISSDQPLLSSNFCEALTRLYDEQLGNSIVVSIAWARIYPPKNAPEASAFRLQRDYFPRIEEIRQELRSADATTEDTFVGTVERLDGDIGVNGRRSGEVILALLLNEGETVRARVNFDADQYTMADTAHMTSGAYVKIKGRLHPGRQPRTLTDVTDFELIMPSSRVPLI